MDLLTQEDGIVLQIENLQVGYGGIPRVHLMAFCDHLFGEIFSPASLVVLHLAECRAQIRVIWLSTRSGVKDRQDR